MRKPTTIAAVLVGLGVGAMVGPFLGPAALWSGVAVAALGVVLTLIGTTTGTAVTARRQEPERITFAHLGPRVEEILRIAEEQAEDVRAEARREAERIEAAARQEAEAILNRAREQAVGISGSD